MIELVDGRRDDYETLVVELHDALVLLARLDDEHGTPRRDRSPAERNRIARKRFLAHQLTLALRELRAFDEKYPR